MGTMLAVEGLTKRFGGLLANDGIDLTVGAREIVGLIGPNGAGKTTFFNCVTGFYRAQQGVVRFQGVDVSEFPTHQRAAMGMGRTFQNVGLVKTETVLGNLLTAQHTAIEYGAVA